MKNIKRMAMTDNSSAMGNTPDSEIRILVAEDNPSNYKLVEVILRRDYTLFHAENGRVAVELFPQCKPHLVLMDINMPEMDGYQALEAIRQLNAEVPIVALTAYAFETDRQRMEEAGFDGCLAKPMRVDELRQIVKTMLERGKN